VEEDHASDHANILVFTSNDISNKKMKNEININVLNVIFLNKNLRFSIKN
jgi:hypothetical protein